MSHRTRQHILAHIPATPTSTAKIHAAAYPGQTGNTLRDGRANTYRHLLALQADGHVTLDQVDARHAQWSRTP